MIRVLAIVPAYNEQESIMDVINEIKELKARNDQKISIDYIVINDCSTDSTLSILKENREKFINLSINLGIGGGMQTGFRYAYLNDYDIAVQVDGDGQHDASYIIDLISPIIHNGFDLVIGSRFIQKEGFQSTGIRRLGIAWLSSLVKMTGRIKIYDVTSGFRAAGRNVIAFFAMEYAQDYPEPESIVMCARKRYKITEIPVKMRERKGGKSSISPLKSLYYMLKVSLAIVFARITTR